MRRSFTSPSSHACAERLTRLSMRHHTLLSFQREGICAQRDLLQHQWAKYKSLTGRPESIIVIGSTMVRQTPKS